MSDYKWLLMIQVNNKRDYKWLRVNASKNDGQLSFIVISVDNSDVAGGKQRGRLASNNHC